MPLVYKHTFRKNSIKNSPAFLVVIGASAGGFAALDQLINHLSPNTDAAYCIVMHLSNKELRPFLVNRLQAITCLPCLIADDGLSIEKGHIYIAQPGEHLLVKEGKLLLGYGPGRK